jgi:hypothetical protein
MGPMVIVSLLPFRHWWMYGPFVLFGCSGCAATQDPCSFEEPRFAAYVATCRARVEFECEGIPDENCAAIRECERHIDQLCRVGEP